MSVTAAMAALGLATVLVMLPTGASGATVGPFNPVDPTDGFLVYVAEDANLITNENEGTLAVGGDLTVGGNYQLAFVTAGNFIVPGETLPTSLVVGGQVDWAASTAGVRLYVSLASNVHIGDMSNSFARWTDNNNAQVSTRILPGNDYNAYPNIQLNTRQDPATVQKSVLDFSTAFATMGQQATAMATCAQNVTLTDTGGTAITRPITADTQVTVPLTAGVTNVLNLTATEANHLTVANFPTAPTATSPLIINVDTSDVGDDFTWRMPTLSGSFDAHYILWNFPTATRIVQPSSAAASVEGTIYAPNADFIDDSPGNNEGSMVVKSLIHGGPPSVGTVRSGEIHNFPFLAQVSCLTATPTPTTTETTGTPTATTAAPTETTAAPTETTAAPTETTAAPTETTAAPTETTAAPTETTTAPTGPPVTASPTAGEPTPTATGGGGGGGAAGGGGLPVVASTTGLSGPPGGTLPVTGSAAATARAWAGAGLILAGAAFLLAARRRRDDGA
ncbi:hypothetical protein GCM10009682_33250 [Luedemannella flava]|uniref:Gram-positive cocci surface proteins LPxTG domain-containing protein n=2 Tax=Luedemannella flava TaxID=349316 RepID=A0ABN2M3Z3_9ACTN